MSKYMVSVIAIGGEVLAVGLNGKKRYLCILIYTTLYFLWFQLTLLPWSSGVRPFSKMFLLS